MHKISNRKTRRRLLLLFLVPRNQLLTNQLLPKIPKPGMPPNWKKLFRMPLWTWTTPKKKKFKPIRACWLKASRKSKTWSSLGSANSLETPLTRSSMKMTWQKSHKKFPNDSKTKFRLNFGKRPTVLLIIKRLKLNKLWKKMKMLESRARIFGKMSNKSKNLQSRTWRTKLTMPPMKWRLIWRKRPWRLKRKLSMRNSRRRASTSILRTVKSRRTVTKRRLRIRRRRTRRKRWRKTTRKRTRKKTSRRRRWRKTTRRRRWRKTKRRRR